MSVKIQIPRESADQLRDETKALAIQVATGLMHRVADGQLTAEEAESSLIEAVEGAVDAVAAFLDVAVALPEPAEALSDIAIAQGSAALKGIAAAPIARLVSVIDDALGYHPRRAARRLANLIDRDMEDGVRGDDHTRKIARLATRILNRSPALAAELGIERLPDGSVSVES